MRQSFDSSMPREIALARAKDARKVGRKHNHQPRGRALEKRHRARIISQQQRDRERAAFSAMVASYWRGEIDTYPSQTV